MSDELRDDIAAVIVAMGKADPVNVAQAIINDLGLTIEAGKVMDSSAGFPGVPGTRVVGVWERCE